MKGLYFYVSADGLVRRWIYRYTSPSTQRVTETGFGSATVLPLADARKKAEELQRQIANGVCPIHAKRTERHAELVCRAISASHRSGRL